MRPDHDAAPHLPADDAATLAEIACESVLSNPGAVVRRLVITPETGATMSLTLHYHPLSSFCHKVLVALYENEVPFVPQLVDLGDAGQRAAFRRLWPIGKFPVLRDEARGVTVAESTIIIEYLQQHYPGRSELIPADPQLALETRRLDRLFDLYVHLPMQKVVGDLPVRAPGEVRSHWG